MEEATRWRITGLSPSFWANLGKIGPHGSLVVPARTPSKSSAPLEKSTHSTHASVLSESSSCAIDEFAPPGASVGIGSIGSGHAAAVALSATASESPIESASGAALVVKSVMISERSIRLGPPPSESVVGIEAKSALSFWSTRSSPPPCRSPS